jgi:hypothetical protein
VQIDNSSDWQLRHLKSVRSWYGNTEFFDEHIPFFERVYAKEWARLIDLNVDIIQYLLKEFGIDTPLRFESEIGTESRSTDRIIEICKKVRADRYLSGSGGRDYLEEPKFAESGIKLEYQDFKHPEYKQRDMKEGGKFFPYMSAIDLLFNEGHRGLDIIRGGK